MVIQSSAHNPPPPGSDPSGGVLNELTSCVVAALSHGGVADPLISEPG